jgi:hypothetical protein
MSLKNSMRYCLDRLITGKSQAAAVCSREETVRNSTRYVKLEGGAKQLFLLLS